MKVFLIAEYQLEGEAVTVKRVTLEIAAWLMQQKVPFETLFCGGSELAGLLSACSEVSQGQLGPQPVVLAHENLKAYSAEAWSSGLEEYFRKANPEKSAELILTGATSVGRDFLPALAMALKSRLVADATALSKEGEAWSVRKPLYAGKCSCQIRLTTSSCVSVRPNSLGLPHAAGLASLPAQPARVESLSGVKASRAILREQKKSATKKRELTEAERIISGGRSLKSADNFQILRDCAEVLHAAVGASRAAVDAGFAPHDMQVGQTGKTVSPILYIACGISGAIQHLAGMRTSKHIIAINTDPAAPIFSRADLGLVGDLFEVVPRLTSALKKNQGKV